MPYYEEPNILFIHIPKTGGTIIENQLKNIYKESLFGLDLHLLDSPYNKIYLQHQYFTTIYKFSNNLNVNFNNIKIFSVVRNPYDKVISDLFWWRIIGKNFTSEQVYNVIKNQYIYNNNLDNHNMPQYKFVTDENCELIKNIRLFKTETLNESNNELNGFLGFNINIKKKDVNKDYSKYLNKDSISLINEFYKKDFELFGYQVKSEY